MRISFLVLFALLLIDRVPPSEAISVQTLDGRIAEKAPILHLRKDAGDDVDSPLRRLLRIIKKQEEDNS
ncbi:hypothetical protein QR680_004894 [Steinernema hermaphroditum]|uniref:Uncharacterized protein n=1 Tax=Steinernema hermaphroditum TaxID=289476 RepID=A0AA39HRL4_9BILA|nr:hypothetical protein QR680_004894 [Steinernema hermaphroditum]